MSRGETAALRDPIFCQAAAAPRLLHEARATTATVPGPRRVDGGARVRALRPSPARLDPFKSAIVRIGQPRLDEDVRRSRPLDPRPARVWQQRRRKLDRGPHRDSLAGPDRRGILPPGGLRSSHRANRGRRDLDRPRDGRGRRDAELGLDGAPLAIRGKHHRLRFVRGRRSGAAGRGSGAHRPPRQPERRSRGPLRRFGGGASGDARRHRRRQDDLGHTISTSASAQVHP